MYYTKTQIFYVAIITNLLLPLCAVLGIAFINNSSINIFVYLTICIAGYLFLLLLYKCNFWELISHKLRIPFFVMLTLVIGIRLHRGGVNTYVHKYDWWLEIVSILAISLLGYSIFKVYKASKQPENVLEMAFPFESGKYLITDGGDGYVSTLMNYHYKSSTHNQHGTQKSMRYAVDIVKMDVYGRTTSRLIKFSSNEDYFIYHEIIISPINGTVVKVQDGVNNNNPFPGKGMLPYNLGNYVVIKKENYYIIMGHMEKGSILIKEGDYVHIGDKIGLIGNSGLTPRPHLHMQVSKCTDGNYWFAEGIPIVFNQTFYPVKNSFIKV